MEPISDNLWVNPEKIVYRRVSSCGTYAEITCNPNAQPNRYNCPEDGWIRVNIKQMVTYRLVCGLGKSIKEREV